TTAEAGIQSPRIRRKPRNIPHHAHELTFSTYRRGRAARATTQFGCRWVQPPNRPDLAYGRTHPIGRLSATFTPTRSVAAYAEAPPIGSVPALAVYDDKPTFIPIDKCHRVDDRR